MQITEKWIIEAVGWQVFKESARFLDANKIEHFKALSSHSFTAQVTQGKRPLKVSAHVLSETDIDANCTCRSFRDSGVFCEHITAVLRYSLSPKKESTVETAQSPQPEKSKSSAYQNKTPYKIKIGLPPNTFDRWEKNQTIAIGIDLEKTTPEELSPTELALNAFLLNLNQGEDLTPGFWQIEPQNLEKLLTIAIDQPNAIFQLDSKQQLQPITYSTSDFARLTLNVEGNASTQQLKLKVSTPKLSDKNSPKPIYGERRIWFWEAATRTLIVGTSLSRSLSEMCLQAPLLESLIFRKEVACSIQDFWKNWSSFETLYNLQLSSQLQGLELKPAAPKPKLYLKGSLRQLEAQLLFQYDILSELHELTFGKMEPKGLFPYPIEHSLTWESRNADREKDYLETCLNLGFEPDPKGSHLGCFKCSKESAILKFLLIELEDLKGSWEIKIDEKLEHILKGIERIEPQIELPDLPDASSALEADSPSFKKGQDWLAFDINFQTSGGNTLHRDKVAQLLKSGQRDIPLPNGKRGIIFEEDRDQLNEILLDVNPAQSGGKFFTNPAQLLYLQRWQSSQLHLDTESKTKAIEEGKALLAQNSPNLHKRLHPYQEEGVAWLISQMRQVGGALLADDMGLGKTLQTLATIHSIEGIKNNDSHSPKPSLIVCPTSLIGNWRAEIKKWLTDAEVLTFTGPQRAKVLGKIESAHYVITTYGTLARDIEKLRGIEFRFCVLDEASLIRNPQTQIAQACYQINATYRLALSGTPLENTVRDLWSIFNFISPHYLGELSDFKDRYERPLSEAPVELNSAIIKRLQMRVKPFYLRRIKQEVAKDLPSKTEIVEYLDLSANQKSWYQELLTQGKERQEKANSAQGQGAAYMELLRTLLRLRQACCDTRLIGEEQPPELSAKMERLLSILKEAKAGGHRVLVFSQFAQMLKIIAMELQREDLSYAYLDGQTRNRSAEVDKFQQEDGPLAFLISLKAGGYGLTLTKADIVIHFDPWWNPAVEAQATDRAHRIGQTKPVTVYKFIANNTVEEKVLKLQRTKKSFLENAIGDKAPLMEGLTPDDINALIP